MATTKVVPSTNSYTLKNYCADLLDGEVVISQVYRIGRLLSFRNKLCILAHFRTNKINVSGHIPWNNF